MPRSLFDMSRDVRDYFEIRLLINADFEKVIPILEILSELRLGIFMTVSYRDRIRNQVLVNCQRHLTLL